MHSLFQSKFEEDIYGNETHDTYELFAPTKSLYKLINEALFDANPQLYYLSKQLVWDSHVLKICHFGPFGT